MNVNISEENSKFKVNRRDFFKIATVSGASIAVSSCYNDPIEKIIPLINPPGIESGKLYKFASTCQQCSAGCGIHLRVVDGRIIGIEGNPDHPINKGGICSIGQSGLQQLYSPSRISSPLLNGVESDWETTMTKVKSAIKETKGKILYIGSNNNSYSEKLIGEVCSEIKADQLVYDANPYNTLVNSNSNLFDKAEIPYYDIKNAECILSFGADFLESWHSVVENSVNYSKFHSYDHGKKGHHIHIGPHLSLTAANADNWINCPPGLEYMVGLAIIKEILNQQNISSVAKRHIKNIVDKVDFAEIKNVISKAQIQKIIKIITKNNKGLAIAGGISVSNHSSRKLQDVVNLLNYVLGTVNKLVQFGAKYTFNSSDSDEINNKINEIENGDYEVVIIHEVNILQSIPEKDKLNKALKKVKLMVGIFSEMNESAAKCQIVLAKSTNYESFDIVNSKSGVVSLQQPAMGVIAGYNYRAVGDIMLDLVKRLEINKDQFNYSSYEEWLKKRWQNNFYNSRIDGEFENHWYKSLQYGGKFIDFKKEEVNINIDRLKKITFRDVPKYKEGIKLVAFNTNFTNVNGRYGNRGWLAEIPNPISQVAWDSWAEINPKTAEKLGIEHGDEVEISTLKGSLKLSAYVYHGINEDAVAIPAGLGMTMEFPSYSSRRNMVTPFTKDNPQELNTKRVGENFLDLLGNNTIDSDYDFSSTVNIKKTGKKAVLAAVDGQWRDSIYGLVEDSKAGYGDRSQKTRGLFQVVPLAAADKHDDSAHHLPPRNYDVNKGDEYDFYDNVSEQVKQKNILYGFVANNPPKYHDPYRFEMVIDLDRCTGCSACVVACYAENNIPVVGKERVALNRHMSWIRIERYFEKSSDGSYSTVMGPATCQQCSNAGCEPVCPVYATYHNPDGLNAQVYNRCVGTRYCANNCIYKQRRFNWRSYSFPSPLNLQLNPAVTVRSKGVMEKCTFCIQRITEAKDKAKDEDRIVGGDEVVTACQSVCPTKAISFGNGVDKKSVVSKLKKDHRSYHQLEEVNFKPAITYLKKVTNEKII